MKISNLGKILTLILLPIYLFATVKVSLSNPIIYKGDRATLNITASGDDIKFPDIENIAGFQIEGVSTSQNYSNINGKISKTFTKSYSFTPTKSIDIPSFSINIDGDIQKTKPLKLKVAKPQASTSGAVQLLLKSNKKSAYVGESIELKVVFKHLPNASFAKVELQKPELKNFWVKKEPKYEKGVDGDYISETYTYKITPQQAGKFTIPPIIAKLGVVKKQRSNMGGMFNDPFFDDPFFSRLTNRISWSKIYSNDLSLDIKPLPDNVELFGDFSIKAEVDKKVALSNKPVNLTITIKGDGNIEDIQKFNPQIEDVIVYADEPKIDGDTFRQKITIISDHNYTIPALNLTYLDKESNTSKTISSKEIDITIKGAKVASQTSTPTLVKQKSQDEQDDNDTNINQDKLIKRENKENFNKYIWLLFGIALGIISTLLTKYIRNILLNRQDKKHLSIEDKILKSKSDKELFALLLPYANKSELIRHSLNQLEENLYKHKKHKIDKNKIIDIFVDEEFI